MSLYFGEKSFAQYRRPQTDRIWGWHRIFSGYSLFVMLTLFCMALGIMASPAHGQTTTISFQNDYHPGGYTGIMDTWIWEAYKNNSKGGNNILWVGNWCNWGPRERTLIRIDLSGLRNTYTSVTGARLKLKVKTVDTSGGNWTNQPIYLYRVAPANKAWVSGNSQDLPQDGAACWDFLSYSSIVDPGTGQLGGTRWAGSSGCGTSGIDYLSAPVATATLNYTVGIGTVVTLTLTDTSFLDDWINNPSDNAGFLLVAPGLENGRLGSVYFHSSDAEAQADRPIFDVDVTGYTPQQGTPISYTLPSAGRVSINIYDSNGSVVRELLHADPEIAGAHRLIWNNLDDQGNRVANGNYTWKLLMTPNGLTANYIMSIGTTVTPDYDLYTGNDEGPRGLAVDETGMYLSGAVSEGPNLVIKQTAGGVRLWAYHDWVENWQGGQSMAVMDDVLYMTQQNGKITRFDATTGELIGTWDTAYASDDHNGLDWRKRYDIAANNGELVISCPSHNVIRWLSTTDGTVLQETAVLNPQGIALDDDGNTYVISGTQVLRSQFGVPGTTPVITSELVRPWRLTVDPTTGELLVFDGGNSQQVKRFDPNNGMLLATYGRVSGRQQGVYDGNNFLGVTAIAAAPDGSFWVTECYTAPRRTAHFSGTGQLIKEFFGGQTYSVYATPDPANPTTISWMNAGDGSVLELHTDFTSKTWSVYAVYQMSSVTLIDGTVLPGPPISRGHGFSEDFVHVLHRNGHTYLCLDTYGPQVQLVDEVNRKLWTMVTSGKVSDLPNNLKPADTSMVMFMWVDLNGDGQPTSNELTFLNHSLVTSSWSGGNGAITEDFTYYLNLYPANNPRTGPGRLAPRGWTAGGAPIYNWSDLDYTCTDGVPEYFQHHAPYSCSLDSEGNIYHIYDLECTYMGGTGGGNGFWGSRCGDCKLVKWNAAGERQWVVGRQSHTGGVDGGEMRYLWRMLNVTYGCAVIQDQDGGYYHVWDQDGLWVGRLLEHLANADGVPAAGGENWGSSIATDPTTGKVYFFNTSSNAHHVFEVTGWTGWTRMNGAISVTAPFNDSPVVIASTGTTKIEAENYDLGGEGIAYHDTTSGNTGGSYRTDEQVDISADQTCSNGHALGWLESGEWLKYSVVVPSGGIYAVTFKAAAWGTNVQLHIEDEDGNNLTGTFQVTNTGSSSTYVDTIINNVRLAAGSHTIKLVMDAASSNLNIDYLSFSPMGLYGSGTGLMGSYFNNTTLSAPRTLARTDGQVNFDWGAGSPGGMVAADGFSVRWIGRVQAITTGAYTFSTTSDDGVRLWVNGQLVIDDWTNHGPTTDTSGTINLIAGQLIDITMEYYENGGGAVAKLLWTLPGDTMQAIPQTQLYTAETENGLVGNYYNNITLSGTPILSRTDDQVNFDWGSGSPGGIVPADLFSVRWSGKVQAVTTGAYTFSTTSDDGVRLWVNGQLVIDDWTNHGPTTDTSGTINLAAGQQVDITMEYYEAGGGAVAKLLWTQPGGTMQPIPQSHLFP